MDIKLFVKIDQNLWWEYDERVAASIRLIVLVWKIVKKIQRQNVNSSYQSNAILCKNGVAIVRILF